MTHPVRVVVVDDHPIFRDGVRTALAGRPELTVVGEAADGPGALAECARLQPDVVLLDVNLPRLTGVEVTTLLRQGNAGPRVLILTMHDDDETLFAALRAGADGYLLKGTDREDMVRAILAVASREAVLGPEVARRVLDMVSTQAAYPRTKAGAFSELTNREREVLDLMAQGLSNNVIARQLFLAPKTVRNLVSSLVSKLQAADRADAIARARAAGLGAPGGAQGRHAPGDGI
jgi:DNA-binding NarL/FixJ family response regulator